MGFATRYCRAAAASTAGRRRRVCSRRSRSSHPRRCDANSRSCSPRPRSGLRLFASRSHSPPPRPWLMLRPRGSSWCRPREVVRASRAWSRAMASTGRRSWRMASSATSASLLRQRRQPCTTLGTSEQCELRLRRQRRANVRGHGFHGGRSVLAYRERGQSQPSRQEVPA